MSTAWQPSFNDLNTNTSYCRKDSTGMCRITTFRSTTDRIYDGGPVRLNHIMLCYVTICCMLCYIVLYCIVMYCIVLYYIISYHISYIISYHIISYHISYHIISYIISYRVSYHIISYHIYHIISYHIISYHIISYHICENGKYLSYPLFHRDGNSHYWSKHSEFSFILFVLPQFLQ